MRTPDAIDRALAALSELSKLHNDFITFVAELASNKERTGSLVVTDGHINANCLGTSIKSRARPVTDHGVFVAYEYSFFADFDGESIRVLTLFLKLDGVIVSGFVNGSELCRNNNTYICSRITDALAHGLLNSPVFRAIQG